MADDDKRQDEAQRPTASQSVPVSGGCREGLDAAGVKKLQRDPDDEDGRLDVGVDETFPASDPPAMTQPGSSKDPPPSSGFKG